MTSYTGMYAVIPASDLERARRFYEVRLGFSQGVAVGDGILYTVAGSQVLLYETRFAGTAEHTILTLRVDDLQATVAELRAKGVVFEDYDFPGLTTVDGIADLGDELAAWFKDSEGSIVGVIQQVG
ncbi:MAG: VOC family protein [Chloroflexi bacterium]|nr:VOC family protein [Chloroflexota bacterium]